MAAQTGRTHPKYTTVHLDDSAGTLRQLTSVNTIGGLSLDYPELELTAWADAINGVLLGIPTFTTTIGGVFDTTDHGYLSGVNGLNVPLTFDVRVGIRHTWEAGEPQFGITSSSTAGVLVRNYTVNPENMTWSATIVMFAGSTAPAWGIAAEV